nr:MAG TPA: hypothetical protein [Caudoviricetes sp.]
MLPEASLWTATQKPQGAFRPLRLLTVSLYHFYIGFSRVKKRLDKPERKRYN